jgi:hypothetical protein
MGDLFAVQVDARFCSRWAARSTLLVIAPDVEDDRPGVTTYSHHRQPPGSRGGLSCHGDLNIGRSVLQAARREPCGQTDTARPSTGVYHLVSRAEKRGGALRSAERENKSRRSQGGNICEDGGEGGAAFRRCSMFEHRRVPFSQWELVIAVEDEKPHSSVSACSRQTCGSGL